MSLKDNNLRKKCVITGGVIMIRTGLVSVTFRKYKPAEIVRLAGKTGLQGIEWGGDFHVPPGDIVKAREALNITLEAGLEVAAYGSYYRVGCQANGLDDFKKVLQSAVELNSPTIRVWAGNKASVDADEYWWDKVVKESRAIAEMSGRVGITISYEYHKNTLTDTNETAIRLLEDVHHDNIYSYWQPPVGLSVQKRVEGLKMLGSRLSNFHVFYWEGSLRRPLQEGKEQWLEYLNTIPEGKVPYAMLEFVMDDDEQQFFEDAEALKQIVAVANTKI
jgi:3-dehydroshikimate dehydratase